MPPSGNAGSRGVPRLDTLERPAFSIACKIGLLTLRSYIIFAIIIMAIKLVRVMSSFTE